MTLAVIAFSPPMMWKVETWLFRSPSHCSAALPRTLGFSTRSKGAIRVTAGRSAEGVCGSSPGELDRSDRGPYRRRATCLAHRLASPFFVLALPTVFFVMLAFRLREPVRGARDGADCGRVALGGPGWTMRVLAAIPAIRRIWFAAPFLGVARFGVPTLLGPVYVDVFGVTAAGRGVIQQQ